MVITHAEPACFTLNGQSFIQAPSGLGEDLVLHFARNGFLSQLSCFPEYDYLVIEGEADAAEVQAVLDRWHS